MSLKANPAPSFWKRTCPVGHTMCSTYCHRVAADGRTQTQKARWRRRKRRKRRRRRQRN